MVVLLNDEDESVQAGKLLIPRSSSRGIRFTKKRQLVVGNVDDFVVRVSALVGDALYPSSDLRANAAFPSASQNNPDVQFRHGLFLLGGFAAE
ncbi:hypothetical protein D3C73_1400890 [compost metagenome]